MNLKRKMVIFMQFMEHGREFMWTAGGTVP